MINTAFKQARWILLYQCIGEHILFGIGLGASVNTVYHYGGHLEPLLLQSTPPLRQGGFIWYQGVLENTASNLKIGNWKQKYSMLVNNRMICTTLPFRQSGIWF